MSGLWSIAPLSVSKGVISLPLGFPEGPDGFLGRWTSSPATWLCQHWVVDELAVDELAVGESVQDELAVGESAVGVPGPALRPFVSSYAGYHQRGIAPGNHRGLPSPYVTMIVTLHDPLLIRNRGSRNADLSRYDALVGGLHSVPVRIVHHGFQSGIQLSLTPLGARALLGVPAGSLAGLDAHVEDVVGPSIRMVRERLLSTESWTERFSILDRWLGGILDYDVSWRPELAEAWRLIVGSGGTVPIESAAREVGWSTRHLRAQMATEIGLTPKTAARVARFDRARRILQQRGGGSPLALAELAATNGYADQAHLAREFRDFAGCPPSQWLAEEFPFVQASAVEPGS
jgi:AraC-like DNA-binding protein